jgi:hypothetical protein
VVFLVSAAGQSAEVYRPGPFPYSFVENKKRSSKAVRMPGNLSFEKRKSIPVKRD